MKYINVFGQRAYLYFSKFLNTLSFLKACHSNHINSSIIKHARHINFDVLFLVIVIVLNIRPQSILFFNSEMCNRGYSTTENVTMTQKCPSRVLYMYYQIYNIYILYIHVYVYVHVCIRMRIRICIRIRISVYVYIGTCIYRYMYISVYVYIGICIYRYMRYISVYVIYIGICGIYRYMQYITVYAVYIGICGIYRYISVYSVYIGICGIYRYRQIDSLIS